jgi:hypothetical protein
MKLCDVLPSDVVSGLYAMSSHKSVLRPDPHVLRVHRVVRGLMPSLSIDYHEHVRGYDVPKSYSSNMPQVCAFARTHGIKSRI